MFDTADLTAVFIIVIKQTACKITITSLGVVENYLSWRKEENDSLNVPRPVDLNALRLSASRLYLLLILPIFFFSVSFAAPNPHRNIRIFSLRVKPSRFNSCLFALPRKPCLKPGRRVGLGSLNINRSPDVRWYLAGDRKIRIRVKARR